MKSKLWSLVDHFSRALMLVVAFVHFAPAADRVIIGNVSRTVEQLPNYAATNSQLMVSLNFGPDSFLWS